MTGLKKNHKMIMLIVGIVLIGLCFSILIQKENYSFAAAIVEVPEGASEEGSDHFNPATVTVAKGTTVEWVNDDSTLHTVTSGTPEQGNSGVQFDSSYLAADKTYKHTFNKQGGYNQSWQK